MLSTKKTIKTIGKSVELSGHIILLAAAVVGLFAIPLALAAADSKNKQESKNYHAHQTTSQPPTVVNNVIFLGNPFGWGSPSTAPRVSTQDFLNGLLIYSLVSSAIGIALSLCLGVPWVAGLVGGLWLAGVGLAKLGEQIVIYAKQIQAPVNVQQYPLPAPSAPPLEDPLEDLPLADDLPWAYQYMVGR